MTSNLSKVNLKTFSWYVSCDHLSLRQSGSVNFLECLMMVQFFRISQSKLKLLRFFLQLLSTHHQLDLWRLCGGFSLSSWFDPKLPICGQRKVAMLFLDGIVFDWIHHWTKLRSETSCRGVGSKRLRSCWLQLGILQILLNVVLKAKLFYKCKNLEKSLQFFIPKLSFRKIEKSDNESRYDEVPYRFAISLSLIYSSLPSDIILRHINQLMMSF